MSRVAFVGIAGVAVEVLQAVGVVAGLGSDPPYGRGDGTATDGACGQASSSNVLATVLVFSCDFVAFRADHAAQDSSACALFSVVGEGGQTPRATDAVLGIAFVAL